VKPGIIPLRPLGVGELLDGAISCIRRNPAITLLIGAAVVAVVAAAAGEPTTTVRAAASIAWRAAQARWAAASSAACRCLAASICARRFSSADP